MTAAALILRMPARLRAGLAVAGAASRHAARLLAGFAKEHERVAVRLRVANRAIRWRRGVRFSALHPAITWWDALQSAIAAAGGLDDVSAISIGGQQHGLVALDGETGNSPFATALVEHLEEPGVEINLLFRKVRDAVFGITKGKQEPYTYGSLPAPVVAGIALHFGEAAYGNVGSGERLDFTVVGSAVNEASRIEGMCKPLGHRVLVSSRFHAAAVACNSRMVSVGVHALRGIGGALCSLRIRARWVVEDLARGQWRIAVTQLPYGVSTRVVLEEIGRAHV